MHVKITHLNLLCLIFFLSRLIYRLKYNVTRKLLNVIKNVYRYIYIRFECKYIYIQF